MYRTIPDTHVIIDNTRTHREMNSATLTHKGWLLCRPCTKMLLRAQKRNETRVLSGISDAFEVKAHTLLCDYCREYV